MSHTKAVIFDLDGTLLDTLGDILIAVNDMLEQFGYPQRTREELITMIGDGARKMICRALPAYAARFDSIVNRCLNLYNEIYRKTTSATKPFAGIPELLAELDKRGIPAAVLSNKPHPDAVAVVARALEHPFAVVLGQSEEYPTKPNPKGLAHIVEVLGCKAEECLYVGDGEMDTLTPRALDMPCVSALWGYRTREQLEKVGAVRFIERPAEVLELL